MIVNLTSNGSPPEIREPIDSQKGNPFPLVVVLGIIAVLGAIFIVLATRRLLPSTANFWSEWGIKSYFAAGGMALVGGTAIILGIVIEPLRWNRLYLSRQRLGEVVAQAPQVSPYRVVNGLAGIGNLLQRPFMHEVSVATKVFSAHLRPGKAWSDLPFSKKFVRVLDIIGLFTLIVPIVSFVLALIGFCFSAIAALFSPGISIINSTAGTKSWVGDNRTLITGTTYNVAAMPGAVRNLNNMRSWNSRKTEMRLYLQQEIRDFVCLQECFDGKAAHEICDILSQSYPYVIYDVAPRQIGLGSGLIIATRLSVTEVEFYRYEAAIGIDSLANKGFLVAHCQGGYRGQAVYIINTHLQAGEGAECEEVRRKQLQQLRQWVDFTSRQKPESLIMIGGDLNISPYNERGEKEEEHVRAQQILNPKSFVDTYYLDHDLEGNRTDGEEHASEPCGSWYDQAPEQNWGKDSWTKKTARGCVFDHIIVHHQRGKSSPYEAIKTNIEDPTKVKGQKPLSGPSDHLPLSADIRLMEPI